MYNTSFLCTYQFLDENIYNATKELKMDGTKLNESIEKNIDNADDLYRLQLLQAFNMHIWDDNIVNNIIKVIYYNYKNNIYFINLIKKGLYYSDSEPIMGLMSLFNYDTFYLFHKCLIELHHNELNDKCKSYILLIECCEKLNLEKPRV